MDNHKHTGLQIHNLCTQDTTLTATETPTNNKATPPKINQTIEELEDRDKIEVTATNELIPMKHTRKWKPT